MAEGWTWLWNTTKQHYFVNGISLCRRWMCLDDDLQGGVEGAQDYCAECKRKAEKRVPTQEPAITQHGYHESE